MTQSRTYFSPWCWGLNPMLNHWATPPVLQEIFGGEYDIDKILITTLIHYKRAKELSGQYHLNNWVIQVIQLLKLTSRTNWNNAPTRHNENSVTSVLLLPRCTLWITLQGVVRKSILKDILQIWPLVLKSPRNYSRLKETRDMWQLNAAYDSELDAFARKDEMGQLENILRQAWGLDGSDVPMLTSWCFCWVFRRLLFLVGITRLGA
jgi:hypothetical protein